MGSPGVLRVAEKAAFVTASCYVKGFIGEVPVTFVVVLLSRWPLSPAADGNWPG